ncbi:MAG: hypothetical protein NVSMB63_01540 [Sediminibacterium sp.]
MNKLSFLLLLLGLNACSFGKQEGYAHIVKRQKKAGGSVEIFYEFKAGDRLYMDSMEVSGSTVVPHDSVRIVFSPHDPSGNRLLVP